MKKTLFTFLFLLSLTQIGCAKKEDETTATTTSSSLPSQISSDVQ